MNDERTLQAGELFGLRDHGPLALRCSAGAVWVSQLGRAEDEVIEAGAARILPANPHTVVQALADARVHLRCLAEQPREVLAS